MQRTLTATRDAIGDQRRNDGRAYSWLEVINGFRELLHLRLYSRFAAPIEERQRTRGHLANKLYYKLALLYLNVMASARLLLWVALLVVSSLLCVSCW